MALRSHSSGPFSSSPALSGTPGSVSARRFGSSDTPSAEHPARRVRIEPPCETALLSDEVVPANGLVFEGLITLTEATRYCPRRRGRKVHVSTVFRWALRGCRGIRLEVMDTPSGLCTSLPALQRFFERLTVNRNLPRQRPQPPIGDRRHEAVEAELQRRFGI